MNNKYDKIIIGAGLYGLYAAEFCAKKEEKVLILEYDKEPFCRATYINQARVHMGYHYPRSLSTALKSAGYFKRFVEDFDFCIHRKFQQVYATSSQFSWTDAAQFMDFCKAADIRCDEVIPEHYFKKGLCDGAFLTEEYTYDAKILGKYYLGQLENKKNINFLYEARISKIVKTENEFVIMMEDGSEFISSFILNAAYASVNQIIDKMEGINKELFGIKYELCEIILCEPSRKLKNIGITVMDGPFFSIMPFGKTGLHSLTSVTFTPHITSYEGLPSFPCQNRVKKEQCSPKQLGNCNLCIAKPESAWPYMSNLADKYMREDLTYRYEESLFSMKPILKSSEVDDSRPTAIKVISTSPTFISVLSGKINTVYDLDEYLF